MIGACAILNISYMEIHGLNGGGGLCIDACFGLQNYAHKYQRSSNARTKETIVDQRETVYVRLQQKRDTTRAHHTKHSRCCCSEQEHVGRRIGLGIQI